MLTLTIKVVKSDEKLIKSEICRSYSKSSLPFMEFFIFVVVVIIIVEQPICYNVVR